MQILVTGGGGFVGSHLVRALKQQGHEVAITTHPTDPPNSEVKVFHDLTNIREHFDVCFHLAANNDTLDDNRRAMFQANLYDPIVLFHNLALAGCRNFVYASSTAVYGNSPVPYAEETLTNPLNVYAESKLLFDGFAQAFGHYNEVSTIGLRYCNIYGPGEDHKGRRRSMISQIYDQAKTNQPVKLFKYGEQRRDWVYVDDVVSANLAAMELGSSGVQQKLYNIGSGVSYSFIQILNTIKKTLQREIAVSWIDCPFDASYQNHTECDISAAKKDLNYQPRQNLVL